MQNEVTSFKSSLSGQRSGLETSLSDFNSKVTSKAVDKVPSLGMISGDLTSLLIEIESAYGATERYLIAIDPTSLEEVKTSAQSLLIGVKNLKDESDASATASPPDGLGSICTDLSAKLLSLQKSVEAFLSAVTANNFQANNEVTLLVGEVQNLSQLLANYHSQLQAYILDPVNHTLPKLTDFMTSISVDRLLGRAITNKDSAVDLESGAVSSTVYKAAGIVREGNIRLFTKSMIYTAAVSKIGTAASDISGESGKTISEIKGTSPVQAEGV